MSNCRVNKFNISCCFSFKSDNHGLKNLKLTIGKIQYDISKETKFHLYHFKEKRI